MPEHCNNTDIFHFDEFIPRSYSIMSIPCDIWNFTPKENPSRAIPEIEKIYFNNKHTTIQWSDGTKTTVGCMEGQEFDEYSGFAAAVLKRLFGSSGAAYKYMNEHKEVQPVQTKKPKQNKESAVNQNA